MAWREKGESPEGEVTKQQSLGVFGEYTEAEEDGPGLQVLGLSH